ncbi:MAG: patatin-like phospholipase family protein [Chloroflexi bacterium]|nr:patatin-like phospholipase family protein [Chloroflexota bacterium]MBI3170272.1 patatin-like phospholipase family protein [Chloroflexota bacterium]
MKKHLSIVIGSGSILCAASLGLMKALKREKIQPDMLVGCSGGSLYAATLALGFDPAAIHEMTVDMYKNDIVEGYTSNLRAAMSGETRFNETSGLVDDKILMERLQTIFAEKTFADTTIPLHIVATDFYTGEEVVLSNGRLVDAARASSAIPMIFPPWKINDQLLVDGAVCNPLPVDVAIKEGSDVIIAIGFELPMRRRMNSYTAVTTHFNSLYMNNILKSTFAFYNAAHHAEIIPILPSFEKQIGGFDHHQLPYIIEQGEKAAEEQIPYLKKLLEN